MFWELSSNKTGPDNLVAISAANIGTLDTTPNHLYYPYSKFDNIKNNMGAGPGSPNTTVQPTPTTTCKPSTTTTTPITTTPATGGACSGIAAWHSDIAYTAGNVVTYNGGHFCFLLQPKKHELRIINNRSQVDCQMVEPGWDSWRII
jgi:chitinase